MCSIQIFFSLYDPQGQVVGAWKALVTSLLTIGYGGGAVGLQLHSGTQVETLVMMGSCCVCAVCTYDICPSSKTHEEEIGAAKTSERMWTIWDVIISSALMPPPRLTLSPSHFTRAMFSLSQFAEGPLMDGLYWEKYYNDENVTDSDLGYVYYENKLLGVPRLRQLRVKNDSCTVSLLPFMYFRISHQLAISPVPNN